MGGLNARLAAYDELMETAWEQGPISFGDNVRVVETSLTLDAGLAGLQGRVFGETTPSSTGVAVVGHADRDYAINVQFDELGVSHWFSPDLLELVDHGAGTTITLDGVDKKWTRTPDGDWVEEDLNKKPWWKRW